MLIKAVILFLLVMAAIGMVGKALFPGALGRAVKKRVPLAKSVPCPKCGKYQIGKSGCVCGGM